MCTSTWACGLVSWLARWLTTSLSRPDVVTLTVSLALSSTFARPRSLGSLAWSAGLLSWLFGRRRGRTTKTTCNNKQALGSKRTGEQATGASKQPSRQASLTTQRHRPTAKQAKPASQPAGRPAGRPANDQDPCGVLAKCFARASRARRTIAICRQLSAKRVLVIVSSDALERNSDV